MDEKTFLETYNASRNGCNHYVRHGLVKGFVMTDGVHDLANTGCHWMLDILATEGMEAIKQDPQASSGYLVEFTAKVDDSNGVRMELKASDEAPAFWKRYIGYTDLPRGDWTLFLQHDGDHVVVILPSEY